MSNFIEAIVRKINESGEYFGVRKKYGPKVFFLTIILLVAFFYSFYYFNNKYSHIFSTRTNDIVTVVAVFIPVLIIGIVALMNNRKLQILPDAIIVWKTSLSRENVEEIKISKNLLKSIDVFLRGFGMDRKISSINFLHGVQKAPVKFQLVTTSGDRYTYLLSGRQKYAFLLSLKNNGYSQVNQIGNSKPIEEWSL